MVTKASFNRMQSVQTFWLRVTFTSSPVQFRITSLVRRDVQVDRHFNWDMSDPFKPCGHLHGLPVISTLQRNTKEKINITNEYCSEAVWKVRYIIYTENETKLRRLFFFLEKKKEINKTRIFLSTFTAWQIIFNLLMSTPWGQKRLRY